VFVPIFVIQPSPVRRKGASLVGVVGPMCDARNSSSIKRRKRNSSLDTPASRLLVVVTRRSSCSSPGRMRPPVQRAIPRVSILS